MESSILSKHPSPVDIIPLQTTLTLMKETANWLRSPKILPNFLNAGSVQIPLPSNLTADSMVLSGSIILTSVATHRRTALWQPSYGNLAASLLLVYLDNLPFLFLPNPLIGLLCPPLGSQHQLA